jgi:hypothetical protein
VNEFFDVLIGIVVVAGILVMTKPGSQGPTLVQNLTNGFSGALGVATGGT